MRAGSKSFSPTRNGGCAFALRRLSSGCRAWVQRISSRSERVSRSLCQGHPRPGDGRGGHTLMSGHLVQAIEWIFLAYFAAINLAYLVQCLFAVRSVRRYLEVVGDRRSRSGLFDGAFADQPRRARLQRIAVDRDLHQGAPAARVPGLRGCRRQRRLDRRHAREAHRGVSALPVPRGLPQAGALQSRPDDLSLRALSQSARRRQGKRRLARPTRPTPASTSAAIPSSRSSMRTACFSATP